jgi:hypothetical protein
VIRRGFVAGLGSAVAGPVSARAQQPSMPVITCGSSRNRSSTKSSLHAGAAAPVFRPEGAWGSRTAHGAGDLVLYGQRGIRLDNFCRIIMFKLEFGP